MGIATGARRKLPQEASCSAHSAWGWQWGRGRPASVAASWVHQRRAIRSPLLKRLGLPHPAHQPWVWGRVMLVAVAALRSPTSGSGAHQRHARGAWSLLVARWEKWQGLHRFLRRPNAPRGPLWCCRCAGLPAVKVRLPAVMTCLPAVSAFLPGVRVEATLLCFCPFLLAPPPPMGIPELLHFFATCTW